ncbi:MAG: DUF559 domain-containing protein [Thermoleophilaceae bacterium]
MAAVLAVGSGAVFSHRSAAALWGVGRETGPPVDVTVRGGTTRTRPGIRIHSSGALSAIDLGAEAGIPCTALPRTLLDLATVVDRRSLARAVDRAEELRVFDRQAIDELLARSHGLRGTAALAAVLAEYRRPTITRSEAEERFLALVRQAGLSEPRVNAWLAGPEGGGYRPDFLWTEARLIVEIDGREHHARRRAFEHDRRRDRRLALAGFETRRYAASELMREPERVIAEVRAFLAASHG